MDYYDSIIQQRSAAEAAQILADECRKKDEAIGVLEMARHRLALHIEKLRDTLFRVLEQIADQGWVNDCEGQVALALAKLRVEETNEKDSV